MTPFERSRLRAVAFAILAASACADPAVGFDGAQHEASTDASSDSEDSGDASSATDEGDTDADVSAPTRCADADRVDGLPHAIAWRTTAEDGTPELRIHVQSFVPSCEQRDASVSPPESRVRSRLPIDAQAPDVFDLADVHGVAVMTPGGPGSTGSIPEIRYLAGEIELQAVVGDRIIGELRAPSVPFVGCFTAHLCAEE